MTVVLRCGRYTIDVDPESDRPLPHAWGRDGEPIYEYTRTMPTADVDVSDRGSEEACRNSEP